MRVQDYPWYNWTWRLSDHARLRMAQRGIGESDMRQAWGNATDVRLTRTRCYAVSGRHAGRLLEMIACPRESDHTVFIKTVYEIDYEDDAQTTGAD